MIITVEELRMFVTTDETNQQLEFRIQAVESFVCKYTNNEFINRETGLKDYPNSVKMGVINLLKWELSGMRDKVGISSETLSRHSVTYSSTANAENDYGYPLTVIGFLKPWMKARF